MKQSVLFSAGLVLVVLFWAQYPVAGPRAFTDNDFTDPQISAENLTIKAGAIQLMAATTTTWTQTTKADFELGTFDGVLAHEPGEVKLTLAGGTWTPANAPDKSSYGTCVVRAGGHIYMLKGGGTTFWRYCISNNSWEDLAATPAAVGSGAALVWTGGDNIYALRGGGNDNFYRYSISANVWSEMSVFGSVAAGGSLAWTGGDYIYALRGGTDNLWRYTISTDSWVEMKNRYKFEAGAALVWTGGDNLYTFKGGSSTTVYRYTISTNSWASVASSPADVGAGGSMVWTGGDNIYATRGKSTDNFWCYSISRDSWTSLTQVPKIIGTNTGGRLAYDGTHIYCLRGVTTPDFWRYDLSTDEWTAPDAPDSGDYGQAVVGASNYIFVARGDNFWRYAPSTNRWTENPDMRNLPQKFKNGTALTWGNDNYIYALFGGAYTDINDNGRHYFYRYSIAGDSWERLADTKDSRGQGAGDAIIWTSSGNIYAIIGSAKHGVSFLRYSIANDNWAEKAPLDNVDDGCSLVWTGGDYLYALRGEAEETSPTYDFWRYCISTDTWENMRPIPESGVGKDGVGDGGSLIWAGLYDNAHTDYIYALHGGSCDEVETPNFYYYSITADSWVRLTDIPRGVGNYNGCRIGFASGYIYCWHGHTSTAEGGGADFWMYEFGGYRSNGTFTSVKYDFDRKVHLDNIEWDSDTPAGTRISMEVRVSDNGAAWSAWRSVRGGQYLGLSGRYIQYRATLGTDSGAVTPKLSDVRVNYSRLALTGTFRSQAIDLGNVENWGILSWVATVPENTSISFSTRTSSDNHRWSEWSGELTASGSAITSPKIACRYMQVRATLTAANSALTPVLHSYTATYTPDTTPPTPLLISINENAAYTRSTSVNLTLSAVDTGSGVWQMRFSTNDQTWSEWEDYMALKEFTLPQGEGVKTIYFQVRDYAGNVSYVICGSIILAPLSPMIYLAAVALGGAAATVAYVKRKSLARIMRCRRLKKLRRMGKARKKSRRR